VRLLSTQRYETALSRESHPCRDPRHGRRHFGQKVMVQREEMCIMMAASKVGAR